MRLLDFKFTCLCAVICLLVACGGGGGSDRAAGVEPEAPPPGGGPVEPPPPVLPSPPGYADADEILTFITAASIPADGRAVVDFQVTDSAGTAILDLEAGDIRLILAKLQSSPLGNLTGDWQSYVNDIEDPEVGSGTEPRLQASTESDGEFTNNNDGSYRYRFATDVNNLPQDILDQAATEGLDLNYESDRTHRVAMQFSNGPNPSNPWYDFVPATGATTNLFTRDIAATANCNSCHDPLAFHGGGRVEMEYCVTCHNPGTTDSDSTNTVDLKVMAHKLHFGAQLPSVIDGGEYVIYGFRGSRNDYSHVNFPQDMRNCQNCHVGTGTTNDFYSTVQLTQQGDNWNEYPTRAACGSCHDDLDFDRHAGGQPDDSRCSSCHSEGGRAGSVASSHALLIRDEGARYEASIESITQTGPGQAPIVDIRVTNPDTGIDYDILNDAPFTNAGASLNVKLGWATRDYTNTGNGEDNASTLSQSALSSASANGDGSFRVEFTDVLPDGSVAPGVAAAGSGVAIIDGHPTVDVFGDGDPVSVFITDANAFFSIDEADGIAVPRRESVTIEQCLDCHQNLVFHGSNRADNIDSCVACHNPRGTDRSVRDVAANPPTDGKQEESIDFKTMVHGIHAAGFRENPLQIVGFRGFTTYVYDEEEVQYPGTLSNCLSCHTDEGFELPLASGVLGTTVNTGADRQDPADDRVVSPATAVCSSCHDGAVAAAHMEQNGGSFDTLQADIDSGAVIEQCELCHAPGRSSDVSEIHGLLD